MKITKRLFSFATAVAVSVSCLSAAVFADTTDATTNKAAKFPDVGQNEVYTDAVNTLNLMGIINGYEDGTFKPNDNVTRAEFTAMLMRTLKLGSVGSSSAAELPFSDIDDNDSDINWAIPNINTAYGRGTINGYEDGTFRPKDNVAYEEAVKMIVCTLGYGANVDVSGTPWYANFISIANQIGILKNASKIGSAETPATRACIAQLLYESLDVKLVENNEKTSNTILNSYLGYKKGKGIIASNTATTLTNPDANLRDDEIMIYGCDSDSTDYDTYTYSTTNTDLMDKLGAEVEYYYKDNGSAIRELVLCVVKSDDPFVVNAKNIEASQSSANQIKYYENLDDDKTKTITLESDNVVVYNGKLYGSSASNSRFSASMIPELGELQFIDSDGNGRYDVVEILAYDVYYVSSKVASTYAVNDNLLPHAAGASTLILNTTKDDNLSIVNKNGSEMSFSSIGTGNIICVAKSNEANGAECITKAVVLTDKVTGTISATTGKNVTISGKKYGYSDLAPWVNDDSVSAPKMQDTGTFYLDINGDIIAFNKNATTENILYGYLVGYASNNDDPFETDVLFKVRTSSNREETISSYKSTTVDGRTVSNGYDVVSKLKEAAEEADIATDKRNGIQQVIKYTTKTVGNKTVFDKIITAKGAAKGKEVVSDELTKFSPAESTTTFKYNSSTNKLTADDGSLTIGLSGAIVFTVPKDRTDSDKFSKKGVSEVFKNSGTYNIEVYDVTASNNAKVVVALGQDNTQKVNSASPVYVLNEKSEEDNSDAGEVMNLFEGFKASPKGSGTEYSEWISNDVSSSLIDSMGTGDIYRAGADADGFATIDSKNIIYKYGEKIKPGITKETTNVDGSTLDLMDAEFVTIIGSVTVNDQDADSIAIKTEMLTDRDEDYVISDDLTFDVSDFSGAMTVIYDTTNSDELTLLKESDTESVVRGLTPVTDGNPSKVLIYMSEGKIRLLCVLPQE